MSNLLASLVDSSNALAAFNQALQVTQNNVANASTPGYARQRMTLEAMPFNPAMGASGGVTAGEVQSARDEFAEQSVRRQTVSQGAAQQNVNSLSVLQNLFDVTGNSGIPYALNNLFQSFSAWSQSSTDTTARQTVIDRATDVATAFQHMSAGLNNVAQDTETQVGQTVDQINNLVGQLRTFTEQAYQGDQHDPSLDAETNSVLEQLSQYIDFTAVHQSDGSVTVLANGQTPLLVGDKQFKLTYALETPANPPPTYPQARPSAHVVAYDGTDITSLTTNGQLGALLDFHNNVLASFLGDANQAGSLNTMAKQFADRVNQVLEGGNISDGNPPDVPAVTGVPLFQYDTTNDTNVAGTLAVVPNFTPDQLAAIDPGPPEVANGIPLDLSGLASPQTDANRINGVSYTQYFGQLAASVGSSLNNATNQLQVQQSAVTQAQQLRQQMSGVDLNEEAALLVEFQKAYEANSKMITILSQLTEDAINILQV